MFEMFRKKKKEEKVQYILNSVIEVGFDGIPIPNYENTNPLEELLEQYNIPGVGIVVIEDFKVNWVRYFGVRSKNPEHNCNHKLSQSQLYILLKKDS
ncbi:MAG: hypothetical protein ACTSRD_14860 [Promethearchaeota archaeon]